MSWSTAAAAGLALLILGPDAVLPPAPLLVLFVALAVAAEWGAFPLVQGGYQTFGPVVAFPAIITLGPIPAALVMAYGVAVGTLLRRRPLQTIVFNTGQRVLSILLAGRAWCFLLKGFSDLGRPEALLHDALHHTQAFPLAVVGSLLAYALATALQVAAWVAVSRQQRFGSVLLSNAAWQVPSSMALGGTGLAMALYLMQDLPVGGGVKVFVPLLVACSVALQLASRRQETRESANLHKCLGDLLQTLDVDDLLNRLADQVVHLLEPDTVGVIVQKAQETYQVVLTRGIDASTLQTTAGGIQRGASGWVLAHGRPLRIADYARDPRRKLEVEAAFGPGRVRSVLVIPLRAGDETLGIVLVTKPIPGYFTASQERTVTTLAALAALALKNARLYEASQRTLARVGALQQIARVAAEGVDLEKIQQTVVDCAVTALGARQGSLALYDEHKHMLVGKAFRNMPPDVGTWRISLPPSEWRFSTSAQAFMEMRPVAVADRLALPGAPAILPPERPRAVLAAPMSVHGRAIGTIAVGSPEIHRWTPEESSLLQALADEAAMAIENARLSQATSKQLQRMKAIEAVSERINSQHNLNAIFDLIADSAHEVLGTDRCGIFLGGPGSGITHMFVRDLPDYYLNALTASVRAGVGIAHMAMHSREPVIVTDVLTDPRAAERLRPVAERAGYRTVAAFPLTYRDAVVGVLRLYHNTVHPYGPDEISLGAAFANQAAIAVQNTRLLQEAERKAHQLALLNRIVTRVAALLRPEEMFETLVDELHGTLRYPFVSAFVADGDHLRMVASRGYGADVRKVYTLNDGVIGRVARTGRAELVEDVRRDPNYIPSDPAVTQEGCVPIIQDGRVVGVINIDVVEPSLTQADMDLLTTLAGEIAAALRNATLFTEVRQARDELQALYESAQALSSSLELTAVLEALVSMTCRRFGYDRGAILLMDPVAGDLVTRAAFGDPAAVGRRTAIGQGAEGWAARASQPILVPDITQDPLEGSARSLTGSKLAVPLVREDRVIGVFSVGAAQPSALGERDKRVLTTLAGYAVVAIENARLYEQTRVLATTDGLTGLSNHRALRQALEQELERSNRYGLPLSLIMIEIDRFKGYNDTYGHLRGDDVLRLVARILEREHRKQVDVPARYGGDEFMLLLPHAAKTAAAEVAERIRRAVEVTPFIVGEDVTSVTLSLGVASFPEDGETTDALMDAADRRMYAAKQAGGNAVVLTASS